MAHLTIGMYDRATLKWHHFKLGDITLRWCRQMGPKLVSWSSPTCMHQPIIIEPEHLSHLVYHKVVYEAHYYFLYIIDLDTNIVNKMSKFADDTKLCHAARNPDNITELQEDINKLVDWANKWQINFNVDKCSVCSSDITASVVAITCSINCCRQQINSGI